MNKMHIYLWPSEIMRKMATDSIGFVTHQILGEVGYSENVDACQWICLRDTKPSVDANLGFQNPASWML